MNAIRLIINGEPVERVVAPNQSLLDFIREDLGLTGSKHGCDVGDCGACTVIANGQPRLACITLAAMCADWKIETIEGVGTPDRPHPIQTALHHHVGAQCGYCTPGFVMRLVALLDEEPAPSDEQIRAALGANICRCTGYTKILAAAHTAVRERALRDGENQTQ